MTKQEIEAVFARVRTWPEDRQAYAAFVLLDLEQEEKDGYELTEDDLAALDEAEAEIERGDVASDEEVRAVFDRFRR